MTKHKSDIFINMSIIDFLRAVQKRPEMYLYPVTLTGLHHMLVGFDMNTRVQSTPPFGYFSRWVGYKFNAPSSKGWLSLILEHCNNDENKAFAKFGELLDEFVLIRPKAMHTADLNEDNFELYYSKTHISKPYRVLGYSADSEKRFLVPAPYHIKIIEFDFSCFAYYYDFYFAVGDTKEGYYDWVYDNLEKCKTAKNQLYGTLEWVRIDVNEIKDDKLWEWVK